MIVLPERRVATRIVSAPRLPPPTKVGHVRLGTGHMSAEQPRPAFASAARLSGCEVCRATGACKPYVVRWSGWALGALRLGCPGRSASRSRCCRANLAVGLSSRPEGHYKSASEVGAWTVLCGRLTTVKVKRPERPIDPADWPRQMNLRLRLEFIAGAEEDSRRRLGRGLTNEELERALRRYPGDV